MTSEKMFLDRLGDIQVRIGQIYYAQGDTAKAAHTWQRIADDYPRTEAASWSYLYLGQMFLDAGDLELSLEMFTKSSSEFRKGKVYELALEKASAIRSILAIRDQLRELKHDVAPVAKRIELAELYVLKLGKPDSAIAQYKEILEKNPTSPLAPKASYSLGWTYAFAKNDWENADGSFASLLKAYPKSDYALGAVKYFESRGAALDSTEVKTVGLYFVRAEEMLFTFNNVTNALENYRIVIDSFPSSTLVPKAKAAIAYIYSERLGKPDSAALIYSELSAKYPGTPYDSVSQIRLGMASVELTKDMPPTQTEIDSILRIGKKDEVVDDFAKGNIITEAEKESLLAADLPRCPFYLKEILEYEYPAQEWRTELRSKFIRFRIYVDAFGGINKAEILQGSGNPIIDEAITNALLKAEFNIEGVDITKLGKWYLYETRVDKPKSMKLFNE
jgi:TolA-binding protein